MKPSRAFIFFGCFALVASAFGQDSLLGKKPKNAPEPKPQASSGGSGHSSSGGSSGSGSRNSGGGSSNSGGGDNSSNDAAGTADQNGVSSSRDPWLQKVLSRKGPQSRSGKVHYGTVNNLINKETLQRPLQIRQAPVRTEMPMGSQIRREDRAQVRDRDDSRFRVGYYQYGTAWRDDLFSYPYYVFDPYAVNQCVISPWYYYSFLPGYIDTNRLVFTSNYESSFVGLPFDYEAPSRYRDDQYGDDRGTLYDESYLSPSKLNFAIDDLVTAFSRGDRQAVNRIVPRSGAVSLVIDGRTSYGVNADYFYDMLMDAVTSSQTVSYQITGVKSSNDEAEVLATHVFVDPWGRQQYVYHRFHFFSERGNVVIRSFETSADPFW